MLIFYAVQRRIMWVTEGLELDLVDVWTADDGAIGVGRVGCKDQAGVPGKLPLCTLRITIQFGGLALVLNVDAGREHQGIGQRRFFAAGGQCKGTSKGCQIWQSHGVVSLGKHDGRTVWAAPAWLVTMGECRAVSVAIKHCLSGLCRCVFQSVPACFYCGGRLVFFRR